MRIIAGSFKGKKIYEPKDKSTRPLKDLTKEFIFNILHHSNKFKINLKTAVILDIFAGVGSFGLECLSRGAKKVIFIENYKYALDILKKNLANLKMINNYEIINFNLENKSGDKIGIIRKTGSGKSTLVDIVMGLLKPTNGILEIDSKNILIGENKSIYIPLGSKHRLKNPGKIPLVLIEVQSGSYLGEDDIIRFEDKYGRN